MTKTLVIEEIVELEKSPKPAEGDSDERDTLEFGSEYLRFMKWRQLRLVRLKL